MVNFYQEFAIPMENSVEEIQHHLVKERKKWSLRLNAADLNRRQSAEQKINLLDEAVKVFKDNYSKKQYDTQLKKSGQDSQSVQQAYDVSVNVNAGIDAMLMQIKNIYSTGNSGATIDLCNQAIMSGIREPLVYQYLIDSYEEMDYCDQALATAQTALALFPDELTFKFTVARILALKFNNCADAQNLLSEVLQQNPDAYGVIALQSEIDLRTGNKQKADQDVNTYINAHPDNTEFKNIVAYAYLRYGDTFLTLSNTGANYINSQEEYNRCLEARKRAYELSQNKEIKEYYDKMVQYGAKKLDTSLIGGIIIAIIAGILLIESSIIVTIVLWGLSAWMMYSAIEPKWKIDRDYFTGHRKPANAVAYILTTIARTIWRAFWGFVSAICRGIIQS